MNNHLNPCLIYLFGLVCGLLWLGAAPTSLPSAVSPAYNPPADAGTPAKLAFTDIWFYDRDMQRQVPEVDLQWLTVVFRPFEEHSDAQQERLADMRLAEAAQTLVSHQAELEDFFCDPDLAPNACFFKLPEGFKPMALERLMTMLTQHSRVRYVHPAIGYQGKTYVFFDQFELQWKSGVAPVLQRQILAQVNAVPGADGTSYRVDLSRRPLFDAVNLLAQDVRVRWAVPRLFELQPIISARLVLPLQGAAVGDPIPFVLEIVFSASTRLDPSSLAILDLRPRGVQKELFDLRFDPYDYVAAVAASPVRLTGEMVFYVPGEYELPPLSIKYTCQDCARQQAQTYHSAPVALRVAGLVPAKMAGAKLMVPADKVSLPDRAARYDAQADRHQAVALLCTALVLLCGLVLITRRSKDRGALRRGQEAEERRRLAAQLGRQLKKGSNWRHLAASGRLLRAYLVARYGLVDYATGGSGLVFVHSVRDQLPQGLVLQLKRLFEQIDEAAARELAHVPGAEAIVGAICQMVAPEDRWDEQAAP